MCHSPHCWSLGDALGRRFSHRAVVLLLVTVCTFDHWRTDLSSHSARTRSAIDGVGPPPPHLLVVVRGCWWCVCLPPIPFLRHRGGVRCAHRAVRRARRVRVCATARHAEGQVLHVAPHTSPFWGGGIPRRTDRDVHQHVRCGDPPKQNTEAATLHSAFLWESAQGE